MTMEQHLLSEEHKEKSKKKLILIILIGIIIVSIGVIVVMNKQTILNRVNLNSDEQQGIISQAGINQTGELISQRTYNSKTFANSDGSFTLSSYMGQIHYKNDLGDFVDTNEVFIDKGDYFEMTNASYKLYVAKNFSDPTFYNGNIIRYDNKYEGANHTIYYKPHSIWWVNKDDLNDRQLISLAKPVLGISDGSSVLFEDSFGSGIDFEVGLRSDGFIKEIIIENKSVAGAPPSANHRPVVLFRYTGDGLTVKAIDNATEWDGINYYDSLDSFEISEISSGLKSYIAKAYIIDSDDNSQNIKVYWIREAGALWQAKVIPINFMTDSNTVYPVRADTVTQFYAGAGDGYVRETNADWDTCHDQTNAESADHTATTMRGGTAFFSIHYIDRIFLSFNTSSLPDDASITSANVSMYMTSKNDEGSAYSYYAFVQGNQSSPTSLATTDFPFCGDAVDNPTEGSAQFDIGSDLTLNAYNHLPLDSTGLTWVNKTGFTKLGFRDGYDVTDTPGPYSAGPHGVNQVRFSTSENTGTSQDPYINVTYTLPFIVNITNPINNSVVPNTQDINYTHTTANPDTCWYTNDTNSANTTLTCGQNITNLIWSVGQHNVTIWVNDTFNLVNSSYVNFSIASAPTTCNPTLNQDWIITDKQVCDGVERSTGTGFIRLRTGGSLWLKNYANITTSGIDNMASGDSVFILTGEIRTI